MRRKTTTVQIYCDICEREIERAERHIIMKMPSYNMGIFQYYLTRKGHVCSVCIDEIKNKVNHEN